MCFGRGDQNCDYSDMIILDPNVVIKSSVFSAINCARRRFSERIVSRYNPYQGAMQEKVISRDLQSQLISRRDFSLIIKGR